MFALSLLVLVISSCRPFSSPLPRRGHVHHDGRRLPSDSFYRLPLLQLQGVEDSGPSFSPSFDPMLIHGSPLSPDGTVSVDPSLTNSPPSRPPNPKPNVNVNVNVNVNTRTVSITPNLSFTLRESSLLTTSVQSYISSTHSAPDPFGLAMWPGAVLSSRLLLTSNATTCLILGCGPGLEGMAALSAGLEVRAASESGAKR